MYQEILKKKKILDNRKPYSTDVRKEIKKMELCDLIYTSIHLDGSIITKEQVIKILDGEFVNEATVNEHIAIKNYIDTVLLMHDLIDLENDISLKVIEDIHDVSSGTECPVWRRRNPILYTFDYNPPHWQEVKEKMDEFIKWTYKIDEKLEHNSILKAAYLHNKIIEIYPFEINNEVTARVVMYYSLMRDGFPIFELRLTESEYNSLIVEYLKKKNIDAFYKVLERGIYNKLEVMLQLTEKEE